MKAFLLVASLALLAVLAFGRRDFNLKSHPRDLFEEYLMEYPQVFKDEAHRQERYQIFNQNLQKIHKLNKEHNGQATFGLNKFSLMSAEEFRHYRWGGVKAPASWSTLFASNLSTLMAPVGADKLKDIPTSVDWRTHNPPVVTPVKDQGQCGSCWAFSTTGNVEGQWALAGHPLTSLSEQNLVDCDHTCINGGCDSGCNGGLMANAFTYIIKNGGIDTEASYPYKGRDGTCKFSPSNVGAKISSFKMIPHDPDQMAYVVATQGPISVAVDAETWQNYNSGVIKKNCGTQLDHGVLIVGYGVDKKNVPYWIVKNSWSSSWGMQGYVLVERGPDNMCGIDKYPITSAV